MTFAIVVLDAVTQSKGLHRAFEVELDPSGLGEPQPPKLRQIDVTIEKVATLLATSAPKGLLIWRDEVSAWIQGMTQYNDSGRAFWIESYGGRFHRVERQRAPAIDIPYFAVAAYGSVQPERLSVLMTSRPDDGLLARILWAWPDPVPFRLATTAPDVEWAINAFDRLRILEMAREPLRPLMVPLAQPAIPLLEEFACELQQQQSTTGGLMRSAVAKYRGLALRLSLVLEFLWWSGISGADAPPVEITAKAVSAAAKVLKEYFLPMAFRVYGDAVTPGADHGAATIARWILKERPNLINARELRRKVRLPGLNDATLINAALVELADSDWLVPAPTRASTHPGRLRADFAVNPRVFEVDPNA